MIERDKEYIIYKVQNNVNGLVYVGATTNSIHQRRLDHLKRANRGESGKFQEAISTYGAGAFSWEQIDNTSSVDELAQLEKKYIYEYNSKEEGYNSDSGGGFKKSIYQYNLDDGSIVATFNCLQKAGNAISATKQQISDACLSVNNTYKGFYWSYNHKEPFEPNKDKRRKEVCQITLKGEVIRTYISVTEAANQMGINKSGISKVCRGERQQSGGFRWIYI